MRLRLGYKRSPWGKVSQATEYKMPNRHEEGAKHRENENLFAAKLVALMAKPACCGSTQNTLCRFNSWGRVSVPSKQTQWRQMLMTYMPVFELHVLALWGPRHTRQFF